jgi:REP element-mobilizing transposase RayT
MTSPRSHLVDPEAPGFYHCISRCVRRAFLCGEDALSGRSFEHRKQWVEERLLELAEVFAVGVYAYAVMSNHLHVVVYVDPSATLAWSPDEVAQRWVRLTPARMEPHSGTGTKWHFSYATQDNPLTHRPGEPRHARPTASPRSQLVDSEASGFYHCISRCIRRAFLRGQDALTGRSLEHRKQWAEDRLLELAEVFAVGVCAQAVMSNHLHVVLYVDPSATLAWSPDEVAQHSVRLTPVRVDGEIDDAACAARATALAGNAE